jgi:pimeloyl-ACP methyl ester carboxylesterase
MLAHEILEGADPTLVLIHGWTCDRQSMQPVAQAFSAHRRVLLDLLGHGQSAYDQLGHTEDLSIAAQARAVLDITPANALLVGHSMGAQIAVSAAAQAPGHVAGLVLLDPAPLVSYPKALASMQAVASLIKEGDVHAHMRRFGANQVRLIEDYAAYAAIIETMAKTKPSVVHAAMAAMQAFDGAGQLAQVQCPGLMIVIDKALNRCADVARVNPKIMTGQVAGSGHMVQYEVMDQVKAMMQRFFRLHGFLPAS